MSEPLRGRVGAPRSECTCGRRGHARIAFRQPRAGSRTEGQVTSPRRDSKPRRTARPHSHTEAELRAVTIGPLEPLRAKLRLAEYSDAWPGIFESHAHRIRSALGDRVLQIEHVGSTAVPGLSAKPIIDILLVVADSADESAYVGDMERAGYALRIRDANWHEHRLFRPTDAGANIHVFSRGSDEVTRMLAFRDRLRTNAADRMLYEGTKHELVRRTWKYTQSYADAKTAVVEEILGRATGNAGHGDITLRPWESLAAEECVEFYARNRVHLTPWEPQRDASFYTVPYQAELQARFSQGRATDRQYAYGVFLAGRLAGRVALSDVVRGAFQSAHIGYLTDAAMCGRGVATGAVLRAMKIAFDELRLHRVQAAVIPRNEPSVRVLTKCGFQLIGLSPRYLLINGRWEDHLLFAITAEDFSPLSPS